MKPKKKFDMNQRLLLQHALIFAAKTVEVKKTLTEKTETENLIAKGRRNEAHELLISASCRLENGNQAGMLANDIGTRALFPVNLDTDTGISLGKIFNEHPNLKTLGGLVKVPFGEVEEIFEKGEIVCPLALYVFSTCYELELQKEQRKIERAAEPTAPALLES